MRYIDIIDSACAFVTMPTFSLATLSRSLYLSWLIRKQHSEIQTTQKQLFCACSNVFISSKKKLLSDNSQLLLWRKIRRKTYNKRMASPVVLTPTPRPFPSTLRWKHCKIVKPAFPPKKKKITRRLKENTNNNLQIHLEEISWENTRKIVFLIHKNSQVKKESRVKIRMYEIWYHMLKRYKQRSSRCQECR